MRTIALLALLAGCGEVRPGPPTNPGLTLAVSPGLATLRQGQAVAVQIVATRGPEVKGPIALEAVDLPAGVTVQPTTIPAGATVGVLMLSAATTASQGGPVVAQVRAVADGATESADLPVLVMGATATLDLSFGTAGTSLIDYAGRHDTVSAMALGPDGKVVAVGTTEDQGSVILLFGRLLASGLLDPSFDQDGKRTLNLVGMSQSQYIASLAQQADGRLLFCGNAGNDFVVGRLDGGGNLDASFNATGTWARTFSSGFNQCTALLIEPDGKIVAAGYSAGMAGNTLVVVRFTPAEGALDPSFGSGGIAMLTPIRTDDRVAELARQPDGSLLLAGTTTGAGFVLRLGPTGMKDASFGSGGTTIVAPPDGPNVAPSDVYAMALQPDGKIVVAGDVLHPNADCLVARLLPQGSLDPGFAAGGYFTLTAYGDADRAYDLGLQTDGKIAVVGGAITVPGGDYQDHLLFRLTPTGQLDASFGVMGKTSFDLGVSDLANSLAFMPDGRWVVAGNVCTPTSCDLSVIRIWP